MYNNAPSYFDIQEKTTGIFWIRPHTSSATSVDQLFDKLQQFMEIITELITKETTQGVIYSPPVTDIDYIDIYKFASHPSAFYNKLSRLVLSSTIFQSVKKPIIGLIDQSCQDTALSIMLWANYRIASEHIELSFNEPTYGLFPGFGGTIVTSRLLGPEKAIPLLTKGGTHSAREGLQLGVINKLISPDQDPIANAINCVQNYAELSREQVLSRGQRSLEVDEEQLEQAYSFVARRTKMLNSGVNACINVIKESLGIPIKDALLIEAKAFSEIWTSPHTLAMLRTQYLGINQVRGSAAADIPFETNTVAIIGSGMMGAGIAFQAAKSGFNVFLSDTDTEIAQKGKEYVTNLTNKQVQLNQITAQKQYEILSRIVPTTGFKETSDINLIIEAVFEDQRLKIDLLKQNERYLNSNGIFATNTTSIPISTLAKDMQHPERFVGMHFFSPVDRMPLVEIIRGKKTDEETVSKALQIAYQLHKIPIVVHDGPAFFTSRIFFNYILESITMLLEGIPAPQIEQSAHNAGFATSPLAVLDEITLTLMLQVYEQLPAMHASQLRCYNYLRKLVDSGRTGRKTGAGLYDYDTAIGKKKIWNDPDLPRTKIVYPENKIKLRLLNVMALDSFRCLSEGILSQARDGDIGSILGVGFPPQTGGVFSYIDQLGLRTFAEQCMSFENLGEQWNIPPILFEFTRQNFSFYTQFEQTQIPASKEITSK